MKIIKILFFLILISSQSFAGESLKYDDIYKVILSGDKDKAYTLLLAFQRQEPDFANTYFQLALIARDWSKEFNPFTEFAYTKQFIYNTKLYLGLAKLKLKEEKKKNRDLYENAGIIPMGKKLKIEDIELFIDAEMKSIKIFEKNIIKIINNFNKSSDSYNKCVDIFMDINMKYSKIKNIYLASDEATTNKLTKLEAYYDSTLIYFQDYKKAIKEYPIKGYNQKYKLKKIITYRLNGLTNSNFLKPNFLLWDYKTWVNDVRQTRGERINSNRQDIVSIETIMKNKINFLDKDNYSDSFKPYKLNEKFVYKIEKYDNNSLLIKLFKLNETKISYYTYFRKLINNPKTLDNFSLKSFATYCYELSKKKIYSDSINKIFNESIKAKEILKYKNFYMSSYNGVQGLKDYSLRQNMFFKAREKDAENLLKKKLYKSLYFVPCDSLKYKEKLIKPKISFPNFNFAENDSYNICNYNNSNNKLTIAGFYKTKTGKIKGFSALSENSKDILKINYSKKSDTSNIVNLLVENFPLGIFTIETSIGSGIKNTLIKYNNKGKLLKKTVLPFSKIPRYMTYDDINNSMIIVFYGENIDANSSSDTEQTIYHLSFDDKEKNYTINYNAKAYVFDIIKLNDKILIFSNFVSYNNGSKIINSKAGSLSKETNLLITVISNKQIEKYVPFTNKQAFFGTKAIKINSNLINILGFKTLYKNKDFTNLKNESLYNLLINSKLENVNSAWHD